jgi:hypothetical protein
MLSTYLLLINHATYITALTVSVSPFSSRPGRLHWVDILLHWVIFSTDPAGSKKDRPCFLKKWAGLLPFKRVASSTIRFTLGRLCLFKNVIYVSVSKYVTGKRPFSLDIIWSQQQPNQNTIGSRVLHFKSTRATQHSMTMKLVALPFS